MMTIKRTEVTVGEITRGYVNNDEQGVRGYDGKLDIRPPYQREFIYSEKEQQAVINTVLHGYPLNVMYWVKRCDDAECPYEVMDGQQRTLSLCEYVDGKFAIDFKNFFNQPEECHLCRAFCQRRETPLLEVQLRSISSWQGFGERHAYPSGLLEESIGVDGRP